MCVPSLRQPVWLLNTATLFPFNKGRYDSVLSSPKSRLSLTQTGSAARRKKNESIQKQTQEQSFLMMCLRKIFCAKIMIKYENEPFKPHIFISNQNLWYELQKTAIFSWKKNIFVL
jgi:hypothetical protein